jgi:hypothetical protein
MANQYYGVNKGVDMVSYVTVGTSSTATTDCEVRVLSTHSMTRLDVIKALDVIRKYILSNGCDGSDPSGWNLGTDLPVL